jgi:hypothetical protein
VNGIIAQIVVRATQHLQEIVTNKVPYSCQHMLAVAERMSPAGLASSLCSSRISCLAFILITENSSQWSFACAMTSRYPGCDLVLSSVVLDFLLIFFQTSDRNHWPCIILMASKNCVILLDF